MRLTNDFRLHALERGEPGAADEVMRRKLIDNARRTKSLKRGGNWEEMSLDHVVLMDDRVMPVEDRFRLDEALEQLAQTDPQAAELVKLRYFTGLT